MAESSEAIEAVHNLLTTLYGDHYPILSIITDLAPACEDLVVRCRIADEFVNCSTIVHSKLTYMGPCCAVNYQRPSSEKLRELFLKGKKFPPEIPRLFSGGGSLFTFSVALNNNYSDFAYQINSNKDFRVLISRSQDFPDEFTGAFRDILVESNTEVNLPLYTRYMTSDSSMTEFPPSTRACFLSEESSLPLKGFYTLSECFLHCQSKSLHKLCGCVSPFSSNIYNESICLVNDLLCMTRWQKEWIKLNSFDLSDDSEFWHPCRECLAACDYTKYLFSASFTKIDKPANGKTFSFGLLNGLPRDNTAIVNIYFASQYSKQMNNSVNREWTSLLSYLGGIWGLMFGASIISLVEFIYYFSGRFFYTWFICVQFYFREKLWSKNQEEIKYQLYWSEFQHNNKMLKTLKDK